MPSPLARSLALVALALAVAPDAQAYVDPGSSGVIWQMIVASALGIAIAARATYKRFVTGARNLFSSKKRDDGS